MPRIPVTRIAAAVAFCSLALSVCAADFQTGQAARAVIGQPTFSARTPGISPTALSISNGRLYVADASNRLLTFDLSQIPGPKDDFAERQSSGCALCGWSPVAVVNQPVIAGIAAVSVAGKSVAIADTANRRVLVWRDASSSSALKGPDVILGNPASESAPLNASTLFEPISVALDGQRLFIGDGALHRVLVWNALPQSNNQPADAVLGQQSFATSALTDSLAADTIARPVALASDGKNLFVADSVNRRILVFSPADFPLNSNAVVNSASLTAGPLAPGALVTISDAGVAESSDSDGEAADRQAAKKLAGIELVLDGEALPLLSISPEEIQGQLPYDILNRSSASLYIRWELGDGAVLTSSPIAVSVLPATPGLFAFSGKEPRPGMSVHAVDRSEQTGTPVTPDNPAQPGEAVTLWAAGLGMLDSFAEKGTGLQAGTPNPQSDTPVQAPVAATVNGAPAEVLSATLPEGSIGIYEVRVLLPSSLAAGNATLTISQDGRQSNTVTIPVKNAIH